MTSLVCDPMDGIDLEKMKARADAVYYISSVRRSSGKVRDMLAKKGHDPDLIEEVVNELISDGRIDDYAAALSVIRSRKAGKAESSSAIVRRMKRLGIPAEIAEKTVKEEFSLRQDDFKNAFDLLNLKFSSKAYTIHSDEYEVCEKFKARMYRFLMSRGYSEGVAAGAVMKFVEENAKNGKS
jgi:SOS response regulatory protein OraA/RecX